MNIIGTGIRYPSGKLLIEPLAEEAFARRIEKSLAANAKFVRGARTQVLHSFDFQGELRPKPTQNLADPLSAGWTFLLHRDDPNRQAIADVLAPLARRRGMKDPITPMLFSGETNWAQWMSTNYLALPNDERPHYVLMIGGPDRLPFRFQAFLSVAAFVGRVEFDSLDQLGAYVDKVCRLETAEAPAATPNVVFFAPDKGRSVVDGSYDATYFSRRFMAEPLIELAKNNSNFTVTGLLAERATKSALLEAARELQPALVYTASHGVGAIDQDLETQNRINGAICCQRTGEEQTMEDYLVAADDVPANEPFLEGAIVFQFACYGYGTPAVSDFAHWDVGVPPHNSTADFIAALPKKLLANPRGPVGFIGHIDTAWLHGFDDPGDPLIEKRWHPRLAPFRNAVGTLLGIHPTGLAMKDLNKRYDLMNAQLANVLEQKEKGEYDDTPDAQHLLASDFITRGDAQNYMIFGDPAARIRVGSRSEDSTGQPS